MKIKSVIAVSLGKRFSVVSDDGIEIAHAYLYILSNDLNKKPFGLMEDVFVVDNMRGEGVGTKLINVVVREARSAGCYKLIATSRIERKKVHDLYNTSLGFVDHGKEFRIVF